MQVPCAGVGSWSGGALPGSRTRIARLGGGCPVHWARRAVRISGSDSCLGGNVIRLNHDLRRTLAVLLPLNNVHGVFAAMESGDYDLRGMDIEEIARNMDEMKHMGLLIVEEEDDGRDLFVHLSSDASSYFYDSKAERAKAALKFAGQLLTGASGGAVVYALGRFLGQ